MLQPQEVGLVVGLVEPRTRVEVVLHNMEVLGLGPEEPTVLALENTGLVQGVEAMVRGLLETTWLWGRVRAWDRDWVRSLDGVLASLVVLTSPTEVAVGMMKRVQELGRKGTSPPSSWPLQGLKGYLPKVICL